MSSTEAGLENICLEINSFENDKFIIDYNNVNKHRGWRDSFLDGASDWADGEVEIPSNFSEYDLFLPFGCIVCKRGALCGIKLVKCFSCKKAFYCGPKHQKSDWGRHKKVCKLFASLTMESLVDKEPFNKETWNQYLHYGIRKAKLERLITKKDPLQDQFLLEQWINQQHCQVCYKTTNLKTCDCCGGAAHCDSKICQEKFLNIHDIKICEKYLMILSSIVMCMQQGSTIIESCQTRMNSNIKNNKLSDININENFAFSTIKNWGHYFKLKINDFSVQPPLLVFPPVLSIVTDGLSLSMTILYGLAQVYSMEVLYEMESVEIHLIGSDGYELRAAISKYEEILHWLPNCTSLKLYCIGPAMTLGSHEIIECDGLCPGCIKNKCKMEIHTINGLYHLLSTSAPKEDSKEAHITVTNATIAIACNSGLHEVKSNTEPVSLIIYIYTLYIYTLYIYIIKSYLIFISNNL
jgi:hypothetical protein